MSLNNLKSALNNNQGFTVAELVVAMTLIGLLVGFSFKAYLFFQKNFIHWQKRVEVEETGRRIISKMADDLLMLRQVMNAQESSLSFIDCNKKMVTYDYAKQNIFRNNTAIVNKNLIVERLKFIYRNSNDYLDEIIETKHIDKIQIQLILKNRNQVVMELVTTVILRNKRLF